jgi:hypothetical protein
MYDDRPVGRAASKPPARPAASPATASPPKPTRRSEPEEDELEEIEEVEEIEEEEDASPPRKKSKRRRDEEEEDEVEEVDEVDEEAKDEEEDRRSRKKKKKGKKGKKGAKPAGGIPPLALYGGIGTATAMVVGVLVYFVFSSGSPPPPPKVDGGKPTETKPTGTTIPANKPWNEYVPPDFSGFVHLEYQGVLSTPFMAGAAPTIQSGFQDYAESIGKSRRSSPVFTPTQLESMTIMFTEGSQELVALIRLHQPLDMTKFLTGKCGPFVEVDYLGFNLYIDAEDRNNGMALLDDRRILAGQTKTLQRVLDHLKAPKDNGRIAEELKFANGHMGAMGGIVTPEFGASLKNLAASTTGLEQAKTFVVALDPKNELPFVIRLNFENEQQAKAGLASASTALGEAKNTLQIFAKLMPDQAAANQMLAITNQLQVENFKQDSTRLLWTGALKFDTSILNEPAQKFIGGLKRQIPLRPDPALPPTKPFPEGGVFQVGNRSFQMPPGENLRPSMPATMGREIYHAYFAEKTLIIEGFVYSTNSNGVPGRLVLASIVSPKPEDDINNLAIQAQTVIWNLDPAQVSKLKRGEGVKVRVTLPPTPWNLKTLYIEKGEILK